MILNLKGNKVVDIKYDFMDEKYSILSNIKSYLNTFEARTDLTSNTIKFRRIVRRTTNRSENIREATKIIRQGYFKLDRMEDKKIKISYLIKLDALLFLSILIGLILGIIYNSLFKGKLIFSILVGALFTILTIIVGTVHIRSKINKLIVFCTNIG